MCAFHCSNTGTHCAQCFRAAGEMAVMCRYSQWGAVLHWETACFIQWNNTEYMLNPKKTWKECQKRKWQLWLPMWDLLHSTNKRSAKCEHIIIMYQLREIIMEEAPYYICSVSLGMGSYFLSQHVLNTQLEPWKVPPNGCLIIALIDTFIVVSERDTFTQKHIRKSEFFNQFCVNALSEKVGRRCKQAGKVWLSCALIFFLHLWQC